MHRELPIPYRVMRLDHQDERQVAQASELFRIHLGDAGSSRELAADGVYALDTACEKRICLVAMNESNEVIAAATAYIAQDITETSPSGQTHLAEQLQYHTSTDRRVPVQKTRGGEDRGRVGVLNAAVVDPAYRRKGLGFALVEARIAWMRAQQVSGIICYAWVQPGGRADAQGPLLAAGLTQCMQVEHFWEEDTQAHGYSCPVCGCPCLCTAAIFIGEIGS